MENQIEKCSSCLFVLDKPRQQSPVGMRRSLKGTHRASGQSQSCVLRAGANPRDAHAEHFHYVFFGISSGLVFKHLQGCGFYFFKVKLIFTISKQSEASLLSLDNMTGVKTMLVKNEFLGCSLTGLALLSSPPRGRSQARPSAPPPPACGSHSCRSTDISGFLPSRNIVGLYFPIGFSWVKPCDMLQKVRSCEQNTRGRLNC